jgi:hypothetical protein
MCGIPQVQFLRHKKTQNFTVLPMPSSYDPITKVKRVESAAIVHKHEGQDYCFVPALVVVRA